LVGWVGGVVGVVYRCTAVVVVEMVLVGRRAWELVIWQRRNGSGARLLLRRQRRSSA